jgi:hypothetical protein
VQIASISSVRHHFDGDGAVEIKQREIQQNPPCGTLAPFEVRRTLLVDV